MSGGNVRTPSHCSETVDLVCYKTVAGQVTFPLSGHCLGLGDFLCRASSASNASIPKKGASEGEMYRQWGISER